MRTWTTVLLASVLGAACSGPEGDEGFSPTRTEGMSSEEVVGSAAAALAERPANPTCLAPARPPSTSGVRLERVFPSLTFSLPVGMLKAPGDPRRAYVVQKDGRIRSFDVTASAPRVRTFGDVSSRINARPNEAGLLGMAFHPRFAQNRQVFLSYTAPSTTSRVNLRSVLARFTVRSNGTLSAAPEELLSVDQPYENHNGGHIAFGPDGYLYAALGDGGSAGDPQNNGQNKNVLLGKILRIDVDGARPYAIPPSNPFAAGGGRGEIYAYGLRNPWRFSFDRQTGELWAGDVGQNQREEIDKIVLGGNYGWRIKEASVCHNPSTGCNGAGLIDPVAEYTRDQGISITGGYVYRGRALPSLVGSYVFGDFGSGRIWALQADSTGRLVPVLLVDSALSISSFAEDENGELFVLDYGGGGIHALRPAEAAPPSTFPQKLSQTGCFVAPRGGGGLVPVPALLPYDVNAALWSDGASKERFFAIPDGTKVSVGADGDWVFPPGSVLVKSFRIGGKLVETRLFVRHADGGWAGYTYAWDDGESDATLLEGGATRVVAGQTWTFPSRAQCIQCHTAAAGSSLGLEDGQLNRPRTYADGTTENQIALLERLGIVERATPTPPERLPRFPEPSAAPSAEAGARAYLHANCSSCHRPGSTGRGPADFRFGTSFAAMGVCNALPTAGDLGVPGARLLAPGAPERSMISRRMHALPGEAGSARMPPLATAVVDERGTSVVDAWVRSVAVCPSTP